MRQFGNPEVVTTKKAVATKPATLPAPAPEPWWRNGGFGFTGPDAELMKERWEAEYREATKEKEQQ